MNCLSHMLSFDLDNLAEVVAILLFAILTGVGQLFKKKEQPGRSKPESAAGPTPPLERPVVPPPPGPSAPPNVPARRVVPPVPRQRPAGRPAGPRVQPPPQSAAPQTMQPQPPPPHIPRPAPISPPVAGAPARPGRPPVPVHPAPAQALPGTPGPIGAAVLRTQQSRAAAEQTAQTMRMAKGPGKRPSTIREQRRDSAPDRRPRHGFRRLNRRDLREAVILSEVLSPPLALRDHDPS